MPENSNPTPISTAIALLCGALSAAAQQTQETTTPTAQTTEHIKVPQALILAFFISIGAVACALGDQIYRRITRQPPVAPLQPNNPYIANPAEEIPLDPIGRIQEEEFINPVRNTDTLENTPEIRDYPLLANGLPPASPREFMMPVETLPGMLAESEPLSISRPDPSATQPQASSHQPLRRSRNWQLD